MSKYIRTENGIYEVKKEVTVNNVGNENESCFPNQNGYFVYSKDNFSGEFIPKADVIKESENIDDLCDEFILFDDDKKIHYQSQEGSIWWLGAALYTKSVRGTIFTNEGIKYVAKMNENNKLELI